MRNVAVEVHAAGVQIGASRPGMRRQDGNQDREGRQAFAVEVRYRPTARRSARIGGSPAA